MQFLPTDQLAALADTIEGRECQLKAIRSSLSALAGELDRTLDALAWDRARLQGLLILAAQPQPAVELASVAILEDEGEAKLDIDSAFYSASETAERPALVLEDLTVIKGVDVETAFRLASVGVTCFSDVAALTTEDVDQIGELIGDRRRIGKENWIEQAAMLAVGTSTAHSARVLNGEALALVEIETVEVAMPAASIEPIAEVVVAETVAAQPDAAEAESTSDIVQPASNVIQLADRRSRRSRGKMRVVAAALAASLVAVVTAAGFYSGALNTELAAHLTGLGACSAEALATDRGCAVLAWLSL